MKILIMSQYFYPEPGATSNRMLSFARKFTQLGHEVTVICELPNYPTGVIAKGYRFRLFKVEYYESIKVIRAFSWPTARLYIFSRLLNYGSYMISAFFIALFMSKTNVIIASSPPPSVGFSAALVSRIRSIPLIGDIQDLWPEYAIAVGKLRNGFMIKVCRYIESYFYRSCTALVTISNGLKDYLEEKTGKGKDIYLVPNGSSVPDEPHHSEMRADCFRENSVNVCYAGAIGLLQPIEDIIEAAEITRDDKSIRYTIIGDGVKRKSLQDFATARNLTNVGFTGALSQDETINNLLKSDIAIVTLLTIDQFKSALPSKLFDYMAVGLPVILGVDGEARELLEKKGTGLYYQPGCPDDLVIKIKWLAANKEKARAMGTAGQQLVRRCYSRSDLAAKMERIIMEQASFNSK